MLYRGSGGIPHVFASGPRDMSTHETREMPGPAGTYAGNSLPFKQHKINEEIRLKYTVFSFHITSIKMFIGEFQLAGSDWLIISLYAYWASHTLTGYLPHFQLITHLHRIGCENSE